ncbi:hypothetical protein B0A70_12995 [Chryseobacterium piscicola]|uniref:Uncharacterized protein n=1 Tax=Chryseobacterium piscicola TaxID=551459 RepID=A0A2S7KD26_9FLAO|nr:hypothetical protein B0A70_12995 [Chryseobacterium piscicola]
MVLNCGKILKMRLSAILYFRFYMKFASKRKCLSFLESRCIKQFFVRNLMILNNGKQYFYIGLYMIKHGESV